MSIARDKWLIAALAAILLGYLLLATTRSLTVAPVLLVSGYCILLPLHLWVRHRSDHAEGE